MKKYYPYPARVKPNYNLRNGNSKFIRPLWMDEDGTTLHSVGKELRKSTNLYYVDAELIHDFGDGFTIYNLVRMDNGEIFAIVNESATNTLHWYIVDESIVPATVTEVKTTDFALGRPSQGALRLIDSYGPIVVVGTYGNDTGTNQQRVFLSRDYGRTWKTIWDTPLGTNANQQHVHSVKYDAYRNYIWAVFGDHSNTATAYTTDWGQSWKFIMKQTRNQFINVYPMADRLIADTDISPDGIYTIPFTDVGTKPDPDVSKMKVSINQHIDDAPTFYGFGYRGICKEDSYPWTLIMPFGGQELDKIQNPVIMTYNGYDCFNIHEMSRDSEGAGVDLVNGDVRIEYLIGVTPDDFTIDGQPYGNRAFGRGLIWNGTDWEYGFIDFEVPKWVAME